MSDLQPKFSVIIPTRDRPGELARCLKSLADQNYPREQFEVIVVNDASRFSLAEAIAESRSRLNLTVLDQPQAAGPSVARNRGAARARGEFLAFTDDDCTVAADWLEQLDSRFASIPDHLLGGRVINALIENKYSTAAHVILDVIYEYYNPEVGRAHFFPTSNFSLRADRFRDIGGFDECWPLAAAEDREFCYRWLRRGFAMTYVSDAIIYHRHPLSLASFWKLHFRYGRGAYQYHLLRAGGEGQGGLRPDWGFYWNCLLYPYKQMSPTRATATAGLLLLWQAANAAGYFWERNRGTANGSHGIR